MQLHSVLFQSMPGYDRLAKVLERSAALNSPAHPLTMHHITAGDGDIKAIGCRRKRQFVDNVRKTRHHARIVNGAASGELIALLDCDTMILGDLSDAESALDDADIAITYRPAGSQFVFNSGVVFVRVNHRTKAFYRDWYEASETLLGDEALHLQFKPRWGGINQSAFGYLMNRGTTEALITELPCRIWNCEAETWAMFCEHTKIVHICGSLRGTCLYGQPNERPKVKRLAEIWRSFEQVQVHA